MVTCSKIIKWLAQIGITEDCDDYKENPIFLINHDPSKVLTDDEIKELTPKLQRLILFGLQ